jgi:predicted N-acetyltransferase YhbS
MQRVEAVTPVVHFLFEVPQHLPSVAALIHHEFWTHVPGASVERMQARLAEADSADQVPLALVAVQDSQVVGAINLVDNDDDDHTHWHPWLAGLVVAQAWRGRGIGSTLVQTLLAHAQRLGFERVHFGTDGPAFYVRLGAVLHQQMRDDFCFMRFDLPPRSKP